MTFVVPVSNDCYILFTRLETQILLSETGGFQNITRLCRTSAKR